MDRLELTGSRIRAARLDKRIRQADLARQCDISPSYLNLIEHNRRRIGGALLNRIAHILDIDPASLSEGAHSALKTAIESAARRNLSVRTELNRSEEFAARFPGWASLIEEQSKEVARLERIVEGLNDRLAHDPFLSASLHEVLSSVTAIRSASAILADGGDIAPEWQARFHRNILEDSRRLAASTEQLVSHLDTGSEAERGMTLPQEDLDTWLESQEWSFRELEKGGAEAIESLLTEAEPLRNAPAIEMGRAYLEQYAADANSVPQEALISAIADTGADPAELADYLRVPLPVVFRRLASLPADVFPGGEPRGLVACDASGTLIFRKALPDFEVPRYGAACPRWPLFQSLQRPMQPIRQLLQMWGRDRRSYMAWAVSDLRYCDGYDAPPVAEAWMLLEPMPYSTQSERFIGVGTSCRVCGMPECPARREQSLVAQSRMTARKGLDASD